MADPGFSQGGGAPTLGAGAAGIKFNFFPRKLHEMQKNMAAGGGGGGRMPGARYATENSHEFIHSFSLLAGYPDEFSHTKKGRNHSFLQITTKQKYTVVQALFIESRTHTFMIY